ncbi:MAG: FG-GAP-like repeat-containing protein [Gemmatimonadales bacterium]
MDRHHRIASGLAVAVLAATIPVSARAQGAPPEVARAQAHLQAGRADSAVAVLQEYFRANPRSPVGRLLLGNAYRQLGDLDRALEAYEAVTQPRAARVPARYAIAGIEARKGNADQAFAALRVVKASGAFDMDQVKTAPEFAQLQNDPRLAEVLFQPKDFENPFVEPVRIIHEWRGEAKGDQFSWIARGIGDADGDGVSDVVTSAPTFGANGAPAGPGRVYLYSGKTGTLLWSATGHAGESLGNGLEAAGDVDRDGAADVIAGAPGRDRAYVYSGRNGKVLFTLAAADSGERFGNAAASAGDIDQDGHPDLIVGAPGAAKGAGRVYLFSGRNGARLATIEGEAAGDGLGSIVAGARAGRGTPFLAGAPGAGPGRAGRVLVYDARTRKVRFTIDADSTGAALGAMFTSLVGDVDGDKVPDVYAADFSNSGNGPGSGRIYVHSGKDGRRLYRFTGENPGDGFGIGSADAGDVNRDGYDDLVVGAWQYGGAAASGGRVYVYSGKDGSLLRTITGRVPGETFGFDATGIGDVDGDGIVDLLLTSSWSNVNGFRSGRMYVISGR